MKKVLMGCGVFVVALVVIAGGALGFFYYKLRYPPSGAFPQQVGRFRLTKQPDWRGNAVVSVMQGSGLRFRGAEYTSPEGEKVSYDVEVFGSPQKAYEAMAEERGRLAEEEHGSTSPDNVLAGSGIGTTIDTSFSHYALWIKDSWLCKAESADGSAVRDFQRSFAGASVN